MPNKKYDIPAVLQPGKDWRCVITDDPPLREAGEVRVMVRRYTIDELVRSDDLLSEIVDMINKRIVDYVQPRMFASRGDRPVETEVWAEEALRAWLRACIACDVWKLPPDVDPTRSPACTRCDDWTCNGELDEACTARKDGDA